MRALLLALSLAGCANATFPRAGVVTVDRAFSPELHERIDRVAARWCRATNGVECAKLVRSDKPGRYRIVRTELPRDNAICHRRPSSVEIEIDFTYPHVVHAEMAIAHEWGHALGLHHQRAGLMRGEDTGGPQMRRGVPVGCIDQRTLADWCEQAGDDCRGVTPECFEP